MLKIELSHTLIDGFKRQEKEAQETVYKLCYAEFMKVALRYTHSYDDAADLLHDAFIRIFTKVNSFQGSGDLVGWMKRILVNAAIDHCRLKQARPQIELEDAEEAIQKQQEEKQYIADEHQLLRLIRNLPKQQVLVFNLYVMEAYSHQEIADALAISVANSKWLLFSARKTLKEKIFHLNNA
ncbi:MAG: RNA polymerase sigma factor [Bacteroidia bacterium]